MKNVSVISTTPSFRRAGLAFTRTPVVLSVTDSPESASEISPETLARLEAEPRLVVTVVSNEKQPPVTPPPVDPQEPVLNDLDTDALKRDLEAMTKADIAAWASRHLELTLKDGDTKDAMITSVITNITGRQ